MRQYMVGSCLHLSQKQDIPDVLMLFLLSSCVSGLHMLPRCIGAIPSANHTDASCEHALQSLHHWYQYCCVLQVVHSPSMMPCHCSLVVITVALVAPTLPLIRSPFMAFAGSFS